MFDKCSLLMRETPVYWFEIFSKLVDKNIIIPVAENSSLSLNVEDDESCQWQKNKDTSSDPKEKKPMDQLSDSEDLSDGGKVDIPDVFEHSDDGSEEEGSKKVNQNGNEVNKEAVIPSDNHPGTSLTNELDNMLALAVIPGSTSSFADMLVEKDHFENRTYPDKQKDNQDSGDLGILCRNGL
ncbi:hypothetical protein ABZP36_009599 [Zizania latifolia]